LFIKKLLTKEVDLTIGAHIQNLEQLWRNENGNTMLCTRYVPL